MLETLTATQTLAFGMPGGWEWLIIGLLGLLIFGRRLPEVGRSIGIGIMEFKKGLKGIEDDMNSVDADRPKASLTDAGAAKPDLREPSTSGGEDPRVSRADPAG